MTENNHAEFRAIVHYSRVLNEYMWRTEVVYKDGNVSVLDNGRCTSENAAWLRAIKSIKEDKAAGVGVE